MIEEGNSSKLIGGIVVLCFPIIWLLLLYCCIIILSIVIVLMIVPDQLLTLLYCWFHCSPVGMTDCYWCGSDPLVGLVGRFVIVGLLMVCLDPAAWTQLA